MNDELLKRLIWSPLIRIPLMLVLLAVGSILMRHLPLISEHSNPAFVREVLGEVAKSNIENVSNPVFAFALASEIVVWAFALAFAFLFAHVVMLRTFLWLAVRKISKFGSPKAFESNYTLIDQTLHQDALLGNAWDAFAKTLVNEKVNDRNIHFATTRPQSFFNIGIARERLFGLKIMPNIAGYFVGLGLLLTFIGLVIALSKASHGTNASAVDMSRSLGELLNAATFKFSTSIAGLFSSLTLSLTFQTYRIWIETGFENFCQTLEPCLVSIPPQALALRSLNIERQQLAQLQDLSSAQYFAKLGSAIAPSVGGAVTDAVEPLIDSLNATVARLEQVNKTGTEDMLEHFGRVIQGGAGQELRDMSELLAQTTDALRDVHERLSGTGEDFSKKIGEATNGFAHLVAEASQHLSASNAGSRDAIDQALRALAQTAEDARRQIEDNTSQAGKNAAGFVGEGMREILRQVRDQMETFQSVLTDFQKSVTDQTEVSAERSRKAMEMASQAAGKAAVDGAGAIKTEFEDAIKSIRTEVERTAEALRQSEEAAQARAREQMDALREAMAEMQRKSGADAEAASDRSRKIVDGAVDAAARASAEMATLIKTGLGDVVGVLRTDIERMSGALKSSEAHFSQQAEAARITVERSGAVSDAFGKVAENVVAASRPLLQASERISTSSEDMSKSMRTSVESLVASQAAARQLAEGLEKNHAQLQTLWSEYLAKFDKVDKSLAEAVGNLGTESAKYQEGIQQFVLKFDEGFAKAAQGLSGFASSLEESSNELTETIEELVGKLPPRIAAE